MKLLLVLNRPSYDVTDVTWNALRLAAQALDRGMSVRLFLMNEAVDFARQGLDAGGDYDLQQMLLQAIAKGAEAKLCQTCISRCGIGSNTLRPEVTAATMPELLDWIVDSERVLTF